MLELPKSGRRASSRIIQVVYSPEQIDQIVQSLDLDLRKVGSNYVGACPVHGGDNPNGFTIAYDGEYVGNWTCWTHHCEETHGRKLTDLTRALNKKINFPRPNSKRKIIEDYTHNLTREEVRNKLEIPAKYYLDKKFSPGILDKYDVGLDPTLNRVIFPIYNIQDKYIGSTGRTINPITRYNPKWKHFDIKTGNHLYNLNFAAPVINELKKCILVESCGNVLKLAQNGIDFALGTFGANLSTQQIIKLECLNLERVYLMFDADLAGQKATDKTQNKLKQFKVEVIPILGGYNDVAEMPDKFVNYVKEMT